MKKQLLLTLTALLASLTMSAQAVITTTSETQTFTLGTAGTLPGYSLTASSGTLGGGSSYEQVNGVSTTTSSISKLAFNLQGSGATTVNLTLQLKLLNLNTGSVTITAGGTSETFTLNSSSPYFTAAATYDTFNIPYTAPIVLSNGVNTPVTVDLTVNAGTASSIRGRYYNVSISNKVTPLPSEAVLGSGNAWYHNYSPDTFAAATLSSSGTLLEQGSAVVTPSTSENSSPNVAKFTKDATASSNVRFQMPGAITAANQSTAIFKVRMYVPSTNTPGTSGSKITMILRDSDNTGATQMGITKTITVFDKWQEYTFDFSGLTLNTPSYENVLLLFDQPDTDLLATGNVYYFDAFQGPQGSTLATNSFELKLFQVFPNPTTDSFQISTEESIKTVSLFNVTGQLVKTFTASENYDISDLNAGIYFATVTSESGSQTIKIIKK